MHMCFRGGSGDSRVARPISAIRGFTKSMKAMSLKAKPGSGGRSRRRRPEGYDHKDVPGAASAKIAPAQIQDEADDDPRRDQQQQKQEFCDKCLSPLPDDDEKEEAEEESGGGREWVAEPEPGVLMTLAARRDGTNRLRRVRFRAELFDSWAARSWWADNCDRIAELYSVARSDSDDGEDAAAVDMPGTPCQSEDEEELPDHETTTPGPGAEESGSPSTSTFSGDPSSGSGSGSAVTVGSPVLGLVVTAPNTFETATPATTRETQAQQDDEDEDEDEWVEEYEPGVFLTVRACPDQTLQLRHVELSRERFGEVKARVWWQENKDRLRTFYSF